jgi:ribonuclease HI
MNFEVFCDGASRGQGQKKTGEAACSVVVYNYLYVTFIIRLLIITLLISNTKNSIKDN